MHLNIMTPNVTRKIHNLTFCLMILVGFAGIDTGRSLIEEIRKEKERKSENQTFLLEPLLALTGSLSLAQAESLPAGLHKCEIQSQVHLTGKLGLPEAIL